MEGGVDNGEPPQSPTKSALDESKMSVRGLLSRLSASPTPSPQRSGKVDEGKLSDERQAVSKMALQLRQKERRASENISQTLSAVLTGSNLTETAEEGGGGGRRRR